MVYDSYYIPGIPFLQQWFKWLVILFKSALQTFPWENIFQSLQKLTIIWKFYSSNWPTIPFRSCHSQETSVAGEKRTFLPSRKGLSDVTLNSKRGKIPEIPFAVRNKPRNRGEYPLFWIKATRECIDIYNSIQSSNNNFFEGLRSH